MNRSDEHALAIISKMQKGGNGNDLLKYYAEKLAKETGLFYADCKKSIEHNLLHWSQLVG